MSKIVGIGANVYDTLITVPFYPEEDTKLRAGDIMISGGGPCATGLVAASKLGGDAAFIGVLTDDAGGKFLKADMELYGVSTENLRVNKGYNSFCSYIWISEASASRTCVFNKGNLPPLVLDDAQKKAVEEAELLMIDGNEMSAAVEACKIARENGTKVLYDAGGLYENIADLLALTDILIPSEEFAIGHTGEKTAEDAAKKLYETYKPEVVVVTQGKKGGIIFDGNEVKEYPAFLVEAVDSNGSGDVFHGAFAFAVSSGYNYYKACVFSSAVSALKCTKLGARKGVPSFDETINFLKERGVNV